MARNFGIEVPGQGDEESKEIDPTIVVHAPMNDHIFKYRQGNEIDATSVESMLTTILQGKAADGQVFEGIGDARREGEGHDEL